jgi:hypothetical protein
MMKMVQTKLQTELPCDPSSSPTHVYPTNLKSVEQMFIEVLLTKAKLWNLSVSINKRTHKESVVCCGLKVNELIRGLNFLLSEVSQDHKDTGHMFSLYVGDRHNTNTSNMKNRLP